MDKDVVRQKKYGFDYDNQEYFEKNSGEIMTIQNEAYSIRDLYEKYTTGNFAVQTLMRKGYSEDYADSYMDIDLMDTDVDLVDAHERLVEINSKINLSKKQLAAKKAAEEKAKQSEASDEKAK